LEPQAALKGGAPEATASIDCTYSAVPDQTQTATATEGTIACANGTNGDVASAPPSSLFSAPITSYTPLFGSPVVDSVPAGAISLPSSLTPSSTDLAGNPRVTDGNGDCAPVQDMGAIELQGHAATCPSAPVAKAVPPIVKPSVPGALTHLTISPSSFFAAPSGATIAKVSKKAKKKTYGTTISYGDAQAATVTFTVLSKTKGRTQGKACKKPSKANKHGKHCTLLVTVGSFTHTDVAAANKLHFSGRLKGKELAKGSYELLATPSNASGKGPSVSKEFKVKG
jgi:hypothetical protein